MVLFSDQLTIYASRLRPWAVRGFTLVEVLVSMMMIMTFLSITMQLFVMSAFLQSRAQEYNDLHDWILEDYEQVLVKARQYQAQAVPYSSHCQTGTLASSFIRDTTDGLGGSVSNLGDRAIGNQTLSLIRTASHLGTLNPDQLMTINYQVKQGNNGNVITSFDTKVTIYAAFRCPS